MAPLTKQKGASAGQDVGKLQPLCTAVGCEVLQPPWKTAGRFLIIRNRPTCDPAIPLLGIYLKELKSLKRYLHMDVHSSIIHNNRKADTARESISGWMDKRDVVCEYNRTLFSLKKKEIWTHVTARMNFENIMLSEKSQTQMEKYCTIPLLWGPYSSQIHRDRNYGGGCQELGEGRNVELFNGYRVSVWREIKDLNKWKGIICP